MPSSSPHPQIAIVIPLFKHSVLVMDALASAVSLSGRHPFVIVVVNDGCPYAESDLQIKSVLSLYPNLIRYVVQRNEGLSAARNTGIEYVLTTFPSVQAIYFLDADNTIAPEGIGAAYDKLLQDPELSWLYPNIDMFGIKRNFDYSGPYSVLRHTQDNICEAGSLVHRRVFDAGIRFDEQMKLGYEDWDFWLTAAAHGFRGAPHPYFGFGYRNRGESMLTESHRSNAEIQAYILRKHQAFLSKRNLLRLESEEAPRYAVILCDTNEVLLTSGTSDASTAISHSEFDERLWRNITVPSRQYIPPFFIWTTRVTFDELSRLGLILWALHDSEVALKEMNIACLVIDRSPNPAFEVKAAGRARDSDLLAIGRELICAVIRSKDTNWIEQIVSPGPEMKVLTKTLTVPRPSVPDRNSAGTVIGVLLAGILSWRTSPYRPAADRCWSWREFSVPPPHALYFNVRAAFGGEVVYPWAPARNIGFVLPIASFGGVERVAYNLAREFTRAGWRVHLFALGQTRIAVLREFADSFASINFLNDACFTGWDAESCYQGTALPAARNNPRATNRLEAAFAWLDVVVNCHAGEFHIAAANLRRLGVKTIAHIHLLDLSPHGRPVGHPMIALAYEYAYDLILTTSQQLTHWMHAAGTPREKLLHVRNAPGYPLQTATREKILARRRSSTKRRLNALFLGRLDRQKGIDRLAGLITRTRELGLPIDWRIVGSSVTGDCPTPLVIQELLEPAVFDGEELTSLFAWADVMVLLSEYEGVPLSILEAQRLGVVVIATDVGALSEIISSGKTGFLIDRETAIQDCIGLLSLLLKAPTLRATVAEAAARVIDWSEAAAELIERVTPLVDAGRTSDPRRRSTCRP